MVPLVCTSDALSPKQSKSRIGKPGVNSSVLCAVELFPERGAPFFEQKTPRYPCPLDHQQCDCPRPHLKTFQCSQNLLLPALGQTRAATKPPFLAQPRFSAESVSCPCTLLQPSTQGDTSEPQGPSPSCCHPAPGVPAVLIAAPQRCRLELGGINTSQHSTAAKIN